MSKEPIRAKYPSGIVDYRIGINYLGTLEREGGPAVIDPDGAEIWMKNGCYHREDGPGVIYADGTEAWTLNGKLHREDGPAVVAPDGLGNYYLHGRMYSYEEWLKALRRTP